MIWSAAAKSLLFSAPATRAAAARAPPRTYLPGIRLRHKLLALRFGLGQLAYYWFGHWPDPGAALLTPPHVQPI